MSARTGVYVCRCGPNISETVDVDRLVQEAGSMPGVAAAASHNLLCSEEGKEFMEKEIAEKGLDRVVVAACSPRDHEPTFRRVCAKAGLNPFCMQMANIRELCSWVTADGTAATDKALHLLRGAVERVHWHTPIEMPDIDCCPDVLVIGAGVAGIEAALLLAQKGRNVTVVEKSPCIGGMATRYEDVAPGMECATCMLEPAMDELLHSDNIELLTMSEVTSSLGFFGNFDVTIRRRARYVIPEACFGCAACYEACPVKVPNEFNEGMDDRGAIFVPYAGALPNVPSIDPASCLRFRGGECDKCAAACGFGAVNFDDEDEIIQKKFGAVVIATGFSLFDCSTLPSLGYGKLDNVINTLELERLVSTTGPTGGESVMKDGSFPAKAVIVQCAGSRNPEAADYCSGTCCLTSLKLARVLKEKRGDADVAIVYSDMCLHGAAGQEFCDRAAEEGVRLVRCEDMKEVSVEDAGGLSVRFPSPGGAAVSEEAELVVLSPAMAPGSDTERTAELFSLDLDRRGFFAELHSSLDPVSTPVKGIYVAGCAGGPGDIRASAIKAKAAAGEVLSVLVPGEKLEVEAITACIDEELCSGCRICNTLCPYRAISFDEEKCVSVVNELLCRGCGTCAAACPSGAASGRHFDRKQICAEIAGVLT